MHALTQIGVIALLIVTAILPTLLNVYFNPAEDTRSAESAQ